MNSNQIPNNFYPDFLNSISEYVLILNKKLQVQWINNSFKSISNFKENEIINNYCYKIFSTELSPCKECSALKCFSTGEVQFSKKCLLNPNQQNVKFFPYLFENLEVKSIIAISSQNYPSINNQNYSRYLAIKAEIWKTAAEKELSKEDLIKKLLEIIGRSLNLSRASFFETNEGSNECECKIQWCSSGYESYIGDKFPLGFVLEVYSEINSDILILTKEKIPPKFSNILFPYLKSHNIQSILIILFSVNPFAFFSFSDCNKERKWDNEEILLLKELIKIISLKAEQIKTQTEKKLLENRLRHAKMLEAIGQLAGGIAHDFNNALGAISGYAEMILQKLPATESKLQKYATAILTSATKASDLTAQLLSFARRGRFNKLTSDIHKIISNTAPILEHVLNEKVKLIINLNAEIPLFFGDPAQIQDVILNLAMNANDAMPDGGTLTITTKIINNLDEKILMVFKEAEPVPYIVLEVKDTGKGMDENTRLKLFEPYFSTKDFATSSGLSLAGIYGIIKSHNGHIEVESELNKGTTITVFLPVDVKVLSNKKNTDNNLYNSDSNINIGIIENDDSVRMLYKEMLSTKGYNIKEFTNAQEAIEYFHNNPNDINLFIIDYIMKESGGKECFNQLKKINPSIRAIIASGYNLNGELNNFSSYGINAILYKPFTIETLLSTISQALK